MSLVLVGTAALAASASAQSDRHDQHHPTGLHLDLEMTGAEYRQLESLIQRETEADDPLDAVLQLGKRNLDWLQQINARRPAGQKLELSTPETQRGIPITEPKESNRAIVLRDLEATKAAMPAAMVQVLWGTGPLPATPGVADEVYLEHARLLDRVYQSASRWLLQEPWLDAYAQRASTDVRGYYHLSREPDLDRKLRSWATLDSSTKERLTPWLVNICQNADKTAAACREALRTAVATNGTPKAFYDRYIQDGQEVYEGFFALQNPRPEAEWGAANANLFVLPFQKPARADVRQWLAENVQDEWRYGPWRLQLRFDAVRDALARVEFEAGATPHVNGLGGDVITMDANRALDEYSTRWTIRHEFGHVLGLPDCYVEFYDRDKGVMINYQIDVDDLMCSRRGKIQQHHVDELRRHYYR